MARDLTPRQNKFIDGVVSGLTYSEAYRQAGYSIANYDCTTIAKKSSELANRVDIKGIIDSRKKQLADKAIWDREKALSLLAFIADKAKTQIDNDEKFDAATANSMTKAIEQANKMCGYNEPEKIDANITGNAGNPLAGLSTEELKQLLKK